MKIIRSKLIGYCFGVANTINKADQCIALSREEGIPCYSIGALIHNNDVVRHFTGLGMKEISNPLNNPPGIALVRAHGMPDKDKRAFRDAGFKIIDATCPIVAKNSTALKNAAQKGLVTIIIGVRGHAETIGLQGVELDDLTPVHSILLCCADDAQTFVLHNNLNPEQKIVAVTQTTFSDSEFQAIRTILKSHFKNIRFSNQPCGATKNRQKATIELANQCDAVIVVGGKNSENTKALARVVLQNTTKSAFCIENKQDLDEKLLNQLKQYSTIGICSGSSTPTSVIREIEQVLQAN